jgi:hypothetical protein
MTLELARLKKVKYRPTKVVAQCPACAETGGDTKGVHLVVYPDGKFGCTANPKDKAHRRRIAELVGGRDRRVKPWTLRLRGKAVLSGGHPGAAMGTPITSLARSTAERLKKTVTTPSVTSVTNFSDTSDALQHNTHYTGIKLYPIYIGGAASPSEASAKPSAITPSEVSEDVIAKALNLFGGKIVAVIPHDGIVPGRFRDVLATWTPTRDHPGLQGYTPGRLLGWNKRGAPVCCRRTVPKHKHPTTA